MVHASLSIIYHVTKSIQAVEGSIVVVSALIRYALLLYFCGFESRIHEHVT